MPSRWLRHLGGATAFTLIEMLVVIGIISILLVAVIPAVNSLSKSGGRKASISALLGAIEQTRAQRSEQDKQLTLFFRHLSPEPRRRLTGTTINHMRSSRTTPLILRLPNN